jgi:hypothetical protein
MSAIVFPSPQCSPRPTLYYTTVGAPNILIALGLSCYTEYWGKLLLGLPREESKKCYESFLKRLGFTYDKNPYEQLLNNGLNIYQDVRCGLVHAYGIDRECKVSLDEADCGICYDQIKDHYDFHIKTYFKDFKNAVNIYIQHLENGTEGILKLNNALKGRPMIL